MRVVVVILLCIVQYASIGMQSTAARTLPKVENASYAVIRHAGYDSARLQYQLTAYVCDQQSNVLETITTTKFGADKKEFSKLLERQVLNLTIKPQPVWVCIAKSKKGNIVIFYDRQDEEMNRSYAYPDDIRTVAQLKTIFRQYDLSKLQKFVKDGKIINDRAVELKTIKLLDE